MSNLCLKMKVDEWIILDYGKNEDECVYIKKARTKKRGYSGTRILIKAPDSVIISRKKIEGNI